MCHLPAKRNDTKMVPLNMRYRKSTLDASQWTLQVQRVCTCLETEKKLSKIIQELTLSQRFAMSTSEIDLFHNSDNFIGTVVNDSGN